MSDEDSRSRILIVDDLPSNIHGLAEVLGDRYRLFFATDGHNALEIAAEGDIDLILLDVVMPEIDGFEVCSRLKSDDTTADIPVIFVSSLGEVEDEAHGFAVGGVDYITKPISPPIVRARVRTHLELKEARDLLTRLASLDGLTGIANRRTFDDRLTLEWRRARRNTARLGLFMADVDHFKRYNDTYGHARGDECLRQVATTLKTALRRSGDLVARYGGEEFAAILPDTDAAGLGIVLRRILDDIAALALEHRDSPSGDTVSISIGAVSIVPSDDSSFDIAIQLADKLLYQAKDGGRGHARLKDCQDETIRVIER
ncbi:MAG: diguanylate cyclase [Acidobacteriota bacterium]